MNQSKNLLYVYDDKMEQERACCVTGFVYRFPNGTCERHYYHCLTQTVTQLWQELWTRLFNLELRSTVKAGLPYNSVLTPI